VSWRKGSGQVKLKVESATLDLVALSSNCGCRDSNYVEKKKGKKSGGVFEPV
jgi:hypothetical protein